MSKKNDLFEFNLPQLLTSSRGSPGTHDSNFALTPENLPTATNEDKGPQTATVKPDELQPATDKPPATTEEAQKPDKPPATKDEPQTETQEPDTPMDVTEAETAETSPKSLPQQESQTQQEPLPQPCHKLHQLPTEETRRHSKSLGVRQSLCIIVITLPATSRLVPATALGQGTG